MKTFRSTTDYLLCQPADVCGSLASGDLHVHTSYSLESYLGSNPNDPRDAYHFARGGEVTLATGQKHRLKTPLDFTAVTDGKELRET